MVLASHPSPRRYPSHVNYDDLIPPHLKRILADHEKLLEQIYGPSRRLFEEFQCQQRDVQRYYDSACVDMSAVKLALAVPDSLLGSSTRQNELLSRTLGSSPLDGALTSVAQLSGIDSLAHSKLPDFRRMALEAATLTGDLERPYLQEMQRKFDEIARQAKAMNVFPDSLALESLGAQLSGVAAIEKLATWALPDMTRIATTSVLDAVLLPLSLRTQFVEDTFKQLLSVERDSLRSIALTTALRHSTIERDAYADAISRYPSPHEDVILEADYDLNLPDEGRGELLRRAEDADATDASVTADTNAHRIAMLSAVLVGLVVDINTAAKVSGKQDVFSPTSRGYSSIVVLNTTIARDPAALGRVINALFFLIYEGAGDDKLRFHVDGGGPLRTEECEPIWQLKHLRLNEDHDIDHGSPKDRSQKWLTLGKDLRAMGLERIPQTPVEFEELQHRVYEGIIGVLRLTLSRFQLPSAES